MSWFKKWEPKIEKAVTSADLLLKLHKLSGGAKVHFMDRDYFIPADPADVMYRSPAKKYKYIPQSRDCDDSNRIFRGWLSQKGFGNLLAMDCIIDYFSKSKQKTVRHACIAFLHNDEIIFGEPQNGKMVTYDRVKIIRLIV